MTTLDSRFNSILKAVRSAYRARPERSKDIESVDHVIHLIDHPKVYVQVGPDYTAVSWEGCLGFTTSEEDPTFVTEAISRAIGAVARDKKKYEILRLGYNRRIRKAINEIKEWENTASAAEVLYLLCEAIAKTEVTTVESITEFLEAECRAGAGKPSRKKTK